MELGRSGRLKVEGGYELMVVLFYLLIAAYVVMHAVFSVLLFTENAYRFWMIRLLYVSLCCVAGFGLLTLVIHLLEEVFGLSNHAMWFHAAISATIPSSIFLAAVFFLLYNIFSRKRLPRLKGKKKTKLFLLQGILSACANLALYISAVSIMGL